MLCEAFGCLPSEAWREVLRLPAGMLTRILEARGYWRTKAAYDARGRGESPLVHLVKTIDLELVQEARDRARAAG